jgi:hypothetical protein
MMSWRVVSWRAIVWSCEILVGGYHACHSAVMKLDTIVLSARLHYKSSTRH